MSVQFPQLYKLRPANCSQQLQETGSRHFCCLVRSVCLQKATTLLQQHPPVQSIIPLKNRGGLRLTTAKYYLPSGESIHEKGVEPDITVKRNKDNFKINTKTDNQLKYAINLLKEDS